jgi:hypothetical protein
MSLSRVPGLGSWYQGQCDLGVLGGGDRRGDEHTRRDRTVSGTGRPRGAVRTVGAVRTRCTRGALGSIRTETGFGFAPRAVGPPSRSCASKREARVCTARGVSQRRVSSNFLGFRGIAIRTEARICKALVKLSRSRFVTPPPPRVYADRTRGRPQRVTSSVDNCPRILSLTHVSVSRRRVRT